MIARFLNRDSLHPEFQISRAPLVLPPPRRRLNARVRGVFDRKAWLVNFKRIPFIISPGEIDPGLSSGAGERQGKTCQSVCERQKVQLLKSNGNKTAALSKGRSLQSPSKLRFAQAADRYLDISRAYLTRRRMPRNRLLYPRGSISPRTSIHSFLYRLFAILISTYIVTFKMNPKCFSFVSLYR